MKKVTRENSSCVERRILKKVLQECPYFKINKSLLKYLEYDWELCGYLEYLIQMDLYFKHNTGLIEGFWFFNVKSQIKEHTGLSYSKQKSFSRRLENLGLIETKKTGANFKKHYRICHNAIRNLIEK